VRIDCHAAHGIERGIRGGRAMRRVVMVTVPGVLVNSFRHVGVVGSLETYTLGGYIDAMQADAKASVLKRLTRIEGQVRGLSRMVEEDRYCIDVVTQLSAVRAALRAVEDEVLRDHAGHCIEHAIASGNKAEQRRKVAELMDVLNRSAR
jgi:CsoR family transcriptional regulator, copper-sensing transcriptional repressor